MVVSEQADKATEYRLILYIVSIHDQNDNGLDVFEIICFFLEVSKTLNSICNLSILSFNSVQNPTIQTFVLISSYK